MATKTGGFAIQCHKTDCRGVPDGLEVVIGKRLSIQKR
jgi:hypothetical protein